MRSPRLRFGVLGLAALAGLAGCVNLPAQPRSLTVATTTPSTLPVRPAVPAKLPLAGTRHEVQTFFYVWYSQPARDGDYGNWSMPVDGSPTPLLAPRDPGVALYPEIGLYSSSDPATLDRQMAEVASAGIDSIILSWWGPGGREDKRTPSVLDAAAAHGIKVIFHIEPVWKTVNQWVTWWKYVVDKYSTHPAWYRTHEAKPRSMIYVFDALRIRNPQKGISIQDWQQYLEPRGAKTLRGTKYDPFVVAQAEKPEDVNKIAMSGMNGITTYLANYDPALWPAMNDLSRAWGMEFIPSVGPGYNDTRIRPWNIIGIRPRNDGQYYLDRVERAELLKPNIINITSFNEWNEGTVIEPAITKNTGAHNFVGYGPNAPDYYLKLTRQWADKYHAAK